MHPVEISQNGDSATVVLPYPNISPNAKYLEIELDHVRASDGIRVSYDFERDGWAIEQSSDLKDDDPDWQEVAFVRSWARYKAVIQHHE